MRFLRPVFVALTCTLLAATAVPAGAQPAKPDAASDQLHPLFERFFEDSLRMNPLLATFIGDDRYDDQLPNYIGPDYRAQARAMNERYLAEVQLIDVNKLAPADRISYEIFVRERLRARAAEQFPDYLLPLNQAGSLLTLMPALGSGTNAQPFGTVEDYEQWLKRLDGLVVWMDQAIVNMTEGVKLGVVQPRPVMEKVLPQLEAMIVERPEDSPFYAPLRAFPEGIDADQRARLTRRLQRGDQRQARTRLPTAARLRARPVPAEHPQHGCLERAAERTGLVRVLRAGAHHHDHDRGRDPPARPERGGAHPRRDGQGEGSGRFQGRSRGVLQVPRD